MEHTDEIKIRNGQPTALPAHRRWKWSLVLIAVVVIGGTLGFVNKESGLISPLSRMVFDKKEEKKFVTVGFLPTWMIGKTRNYGKEIDQLIFSAVEVGGDGGLVWDAQSKKLNGEEYGKLKEDIRRNGKKNILGIKQFNDKKIDEILASESARKRMLVEVGSLVDTGKFDGVNIDFEYMSDPMRILQDDFLKLFEEAKEAGWGETSIDVFANTVIKGDPQKLALAAAKLDSVIVMAYDFKRPGSKVAGPVAPLSADPGERNIREIVDKIVSFQINGEKFVLAYPLYGYQWETVSEEFGSPTMAGGYGKTVFYSEGVGVTNVNWNDQAMSPWAAWTEKERRSKVTRQKVGKYWKNVTTYYFIDQWHQAYFENEQSLLAKLQLAKSTGMRGIGYWALGYEGKESALIGDLNSQLSQLSEN